MPVGQPDLSGLPGEERPAPEGKKPAGEANIPKGKRPACGEPGQPQPGEPGDDDLSAAGPGIRGSVPAEVAARRPARISDEEARRFFANWRDDEEESRQPGGPR